MTSVGLSVTTAGGSTSASLTVGGTPPPPTGTQHGISIGQSSVPIMVALVHPKSIRCYDGGIPASYAATATAHLVPSPVNVFESIKATPGTLAQPANASLVRAILKGLPAGAIICDQHEVENPAKANDPAGYRLDWTGKGGLLDLVDAENATRAPGAHIEAIPTFMGYSLLTAAQGGPQVWRDIWGTWMPQDPRIKTVGLDCYTTAAVKAAQAFAIAHGLDWVIPEYGYEADVTKPAPNDPEFEARIVTDSAIWRSGHAAKGVWLWSSQNNTINHLPGTVSAWAALCAL